MLCAYVRKYMRPCSSSNNNRTRRRLLRVFALAVTAPICLTDPQLRSLEKKGHEDFGRMLNGGTACPIRPRDRNGGPLTSRDWLVRLQ